MTGAGDDATARARATEQQMADEERFSLIVSVMGANPFFPDRDARIPEGVPMSVGYVPGVPRLGVPALLMIDASLGVTNPATGRGIPPRRCRRVSRSVPASIPPWPVPRVGWSVARH